MPKQCKNDVVDVVSKNITIKTNKTFHAENQTKHTRKNVLPANLWITFFMCIKLQILQIKHFSFKNQNGTFEFNFSQDCFLHKIETLVSLKNQYISQIVFIKAININKAWKT